MAILDELKAKANGAADTANNIQEAVSMMEFGSGSVSPEDVSSAVAVYLDEHLTNPTNPPIDTSLTIEGAAADAKKTGDELSTIKEDLRANSTYINEGIGYWSQGGLNTNTGANLTADNRCRTPNYINFREASNLVTITAKSGYKFNLFEFTETLTFVKCYDWADSALTEAFDTSHYYRMVVANADDSTLAPADVPSDVVDIVYVTNTNSALEESPNLFYLIIPKQTKSGITITENADGTVTVNGTATAKVAFFIMGASGSGLDCEPNLEAGVTYIFSRQLVSGTEVSGNPFFQYMDANQTTLKTLLVRTPYVFGANARAMLCFLSGYKFTNATYKFNVVKSDYPVPYIQRNTFTAKDDVARHWIKQYKPYNGNNTYFTVSVDRPLPFGTDDTPTETVDIECALKLPNTYTENDKPTRLILCCHGSGSYISASANKWGTTDFQNFVNTLASNGYGVFDCNIFPSTADTSVVGYHLGSPLYVQACKKAYDYIVYNYNVYPEIFVHGISMGGVGATAFANVYPKIVLAESSFAGRDFLLYIHSAVTSWTADDKLKFANAYGYDTYADAETDKWNHCVGYYPSLSLMGISDGALELPPDRETNFSDWMEWFSAFLDYAKTDTFGTYTARRSVPYKAWNSWGDRVGDTKLEEILQKAYTTGNSCPYYIVKYDSYSHDQMCYGKVENMIPQLMAYYGQFE